jgi:hypothetical protein
MMAENPMGAIAIARRQIKIQNTQTSKMSDREIDQFEAKLLGITKRFLAKNTDTLSEHDVKKLYALFFRHIRTQYILGKAYADHFEHAPIQTIDLENIDTLTKEALRHYLELIGVR